MNALWMLLARHARAYSNHQLVFPSKQLSVAFATAKCTGNVQLEEMIRRTGLRVKGIDSIMEEDGYLQEQLYLALGKASDSGDEHHVQWLLQNGAQPSSARSPTAAARLPTALQYAMKKGQTGIVRSLLDAGADVNAVPCAVGGCTALQAAAQGGHLLLVGFYSQ